MKTIKIAGLLLFTLALNSAQATTYFVRSNGGSNSNDGKTTATAFQTLDKAIYNPALTDGDVVDIQGTFDLTTAKTLNKSITIQGTDKTKTILNGKEGAINNCFNIGNWTPSEKQITVVIENVSFQNFDNYSEDKATMGGVINVMTGSMLTCRSVNFISNKAYIGGAISMGAATLVLEDCYFANNKALNYPNNLDSSNPGLYADGGAVNVTVGPTMKVNDETVPNTANVSLTINRCTFEGNSADRNGSAVRFRTETTGKATCLIQNSTFAANIMEAKTNDQGGVIMVENKSENSDIQFINNTIAYNSSKLTRSNAKAGLVVVGNKNAKVILKNNILFSNLNAESTPKSSSIYSVVNLKESKNNITDVPASIFNFDKKTESGASAGNINDVTGDKLGLATTLANDGGVTTTLALNAKSIAVNAGAKGAPDTDQRGVKRDKSPDVGAFEYKK